MLRGLLLQTQVSCRQYSTVRKVLLWPAKHQDEAKINPQFSSAEQHKPNTAFSPESTEAVRARHLLRILLRECTYLPSVTARHYIAQHVLSRFHETSYKAWKRHAEMTKPNGFNFRDRLKVQEKEARKAVTTLQRANEGERKCLLKVLLMTYGRIGKRRHELMRSLLPVRSAKEDEKESTKTLYKIHLTPQLRALLESQMKMKPPDLTRPNPKRLEPEIPELNSWLRPMPLKRVSNMNKKHYALLLDRVLPPLPTEEWHQLRELAVGKKDNDALRRRERPAMSVMQRQAQGEKQSLLEMVVQFGRVPAGEVFVNKDAHNITPRFIQRLYAQVFSLCPLMEWDAAKEEWKVRWGEQALYDTEGGAVSTSATVKQSDGGDAADYVGVDQHIKSPSIAANG